MGGIVKSIGRSVKKLGKSVGRFLKKYRTTIILAAALWAGLGAFGASASGASIWSPASVSAGVKQIFGFGTGVGTKMLSPTDAGYFDQLTKVGKYSGDMVKSKSILSGLKEWFKDMPDWGKYALTQTAMTVAGNLLDTSAEEELAARYGAMGIPYGAKMDDPTAIFKEHPEWMVPAPPTGPIFGGGGRAPQTSTQQQAQLTRGPGVVGQPRQQQITAMRTTPLDVNPPGILSGRSPGLISMGANQRRYG
tara:strand:- start:402 stop:1148 length:747 start_codon:yes stop_codon:yes gene_type:complete